MLRAGRHHVMADHLSRIDSGEPPVGIDDDLHDATLFMADAAPSWYADILQLLSTSQYPPGYTPKQKCRLLFKSRPYSLLQGHLYHCGHDGISRKCAYPHEVSNLVADAHDGGGAGHYPGYIAAQRILHSGMWWPTLFKDCITYANACDTC